MHLYTFICTHSSVHSSSVHNSSVHNSSVYIQARDGGALPPPSTWLAVTGVAFGLVSTFFSWSYRQAANALRSFDAKVEPRDVVKRLELGAQLNLLGMGASVLALQAEVGSLLTKTLTSSAANPYAARAAAPVAFDVFTVQVCLFVVLFSRIY